jgi:hypothetical protein
MSIQQDLNVIPRKIFDDAMIPEKTVRHENIEPQTFSMNASLPAKYSISTASVDNLVIKSFACDLTPVPVKAFSLALIF